MRDASEPVKGTIDQALWNASRLLLKAPVLALEQIGEIERAEPDNAAALLLMAQAYRACGNADDAHQAANRILIKTPEHAGALRELALASLMRDGRHEAELLLERVVKSVPHDAGAWAILAEIRRLSGNIDGAEQAIRMSIAGSIHDQECLTAALALSEERLTDAEHVLRLRLRDYPTEVTTIRMMAELATRLGRLGDAEKLLRRALEIAPFFEGARELLARNLQRMNRPSDALAHVELLIADAPDNPSFKMLKASLLVKIGDQEAARQMYEEVLADYPKQAKAWMSLGHVLKTLGRQQQGIEAYRRALAELPDLGEAWWSLANLKTFRFTDADVARMSDALAQCNNNADKLHLHFALGKACEDNRDYEAAFAHWSAGNAIHHQTLSYDAAETHQSVSRAKAFYTHEILRRQEGHTADDPIFIVGMPRAGSTLIEQILASHSQIEGTMELSEMMDIAGRLSADAQKSGLSFPENLGNLSSEQLRHLGEEYIERTRIHRKTDRPYFIDKMPNNWLHVGLIRMILPSARIIDARRHPMAGCFSMWKQHFARGQAFSYDMGDLARYYADYWSLMEHFDLEMPGMVHRVFYEKMVADSSAEVRILLDFIGVPFEEGCLSFWRNDRAVRTASSEQVRQPIFSDAVDHWRNFERWLEPLRRDLAPLVALYPRIEPDLLRN